MSSGLTPAPASSTIPPSKPTPYRSKKKLRMDSHYFNSSSSLPLPRVPTPGAKMPEVVAVEKEKKKKKEITLPSTEYTTNSPDWFRHVFGTDADGPTQASSAPYGGKTFSGRPKHYDAAASASASASARSSSSEDGIKKVPGNLRGFSQLYEIAVGDEVYAEIAAATTATAGGVGCDGFLRRLSMAPPPPPPAPPSGGGGEVVAQRVKRGVAEAGKKKGKRALPMEFIDNEEKRRNQARARIEENWRFGRALARKHILSLSTNSAAMEKWRTGGAEVVEGHGSGGGGEEQSENGIEALVGDKQVYDTRGKKSSFLYLQVDVVMPLGDGLHT